MNYTKRYNRCKLKEELIIITKGKCNRFDKIHQKLVDRTRRKIKADNKKKSAKYCIDCIKNQEGFCLLYNRWAFHARNSCIDMKGKVCK